MQAPMPGQRPRLFDYFRSSASYRVRIALNLKGVEYEAVPVDLRVGEQAAPGYLAVNPQGRVPCFEVNGQALGQSLAIMDYLEHLYPQPALLPADPLARARVLEMCYIIACDIHPLNNLKVLNYLTNQMEIVEDRKLQWYRHWVGEGLAVIESRLRQDRNRRADVCCGENITWADICLVPQVYNALRFDCSVSELTSIMTVYESCIKHPAFIKASPDVTNQMN